jgi:flagellar P-ring protein precursor FlgI
LATFTVLAILIGEDMKKIIGIISLLIASMFSEQAFAQKVKDFVEVEGARSNPLIGEGLVIGLNNNGDSPKGVTGQRLLSFIKNHSGWGITEADINTKNCALVTVQTELPPFQSEGTKIDVRVLAIGDAKSLQGGTLLITPLRSPRPKADDPTVYALAWGQLIIEGDPRTGNQTSAVIPNGAIIERPLVHQFVKTLGKNPIITLHLDKPDFSTANTIANAINASGHLGFTQDQAVDFGLARPINGGTIELKIPSLADFQRYQIKEYTNYQTKPVEFLSRILDIHVEFGEENAIVIINDKTKVISVTEGVMVRRGYAIKGNIKIDIPEDKPLRTVLDEIDKKAITPQDLIDLIKALDQLGLIKGKVISN